MLILQCYIVLFEIADSLLSIMLKNKKTVLNQILATIILCLNLGVL